MNTITEITHKNLIKKFHTLLSKYSVSNETKMALLSGYGVESSVDMTVDQLLELCDCIVRTFEKAQTDEQAKLDAMRKRLIASIFAWRKSLGTSADMNLVKAIACRAAEIPEGYALSIRFNSIPEQKLQSLYNAFSNMAKDMHKVRELNQEMIDRITSHN